MTSRSTELSLKDCRRKAESRLNHICPSEVKEVKDEGCPVIEESGTVCGEKETLSIFQEFRKVYEDCIKRLEETPDGAALLAKMTPFRKIVDDLWEQNNLLVEAVEELEQEATVHVTNLQNKLDKSCQKELHCILKTKEREFQAIAKELCEKNELIKKHSCRIEQLEQEIHVKNKQCKELLRRLKRVTTRSSCQSGEEEYDEDDFDECDVTAMDKSLNGCITDLENQTHLLVQKSQDAELQMQMMTSERKKLIIERNEMGNKLQCAMNENERLTKELARLKTCLAEKEDFNKMTEQLKQEKCELIKKVNGLQENIKEINNNFKESRWALASEVAEKHDQVHEAQRRIVELEEQLRHADQQIQFKEDIVRELRKELRSTRKSSQMCNLDKPQKPTVREHSPPTQLIGPKSLNVSGPDKTINDDDLKFDIHIYSLTDNVRCKQSVKKTEKGPELRSVDVQTEVFGSTSPTPLKVRNVSTQHRTRVQKLPRSFGTLTVTPWSGTTGQIASDDICIEYIQENKKNQKGVFTVPFSST